MTIFCQIQHVYCPRISPQSLVEEPFLCYSSATSFSGNSQGDNSIPRFQKYLAHAGSISRIPNSASAFARINAAACFAPSDSGAVTTKLKSGISISLENETRLVTSNDNRRAPLRITPGVSYLSATLSTHVLSGKISSSVEYRLSGGPMNDNGQPSYNKVSGAILFRKTFITALSSSLSISELLC